MSPTAGEGLRSTRGGDPDRVQGWVGGVGEDHSGGKSGAQVVEDVGGDAFAGQDGRDPWRVRGDLFRSDPADSFLDWDLFGAAEKRVPGDVCGVQVEVTWVGQVDVRRPGHRRCSRGEVPQRGGQPVGGVDVVGHRQGRLDAAVIAKAHVELVVFP